MTDEHMQTNITISFQPEDRQVKGKVNYSSNTRCNPFKMYLFQLNPNCASQVENYTTGKCGLRGKRGLQGKRKIERLCMTDEHMDEHNNTNKFIQLEDRQVKGKVNSSNTRCNLFKMYLFQLNPNCASQIEYCANSRKTGTLYFTKPDQCKVLI